VANLLTEFLPSRPCDNFMMPAERPLDDVGRCCWNRDRCLGRSVFDRERQSQALGNALFFTGCPRKSIHSGGLRRNRMESFFYFLETGRN